MTFKCRFNATCFLFKINRFVLIFSKTSNRFVLKICSGGFADYIYRYSIKKVGSFSKKHRSVSGKSCLPFFINITSKYFQCLFYASVTSFF